jgi:hypothetical protein
MLLKSGLKWVHQHFGEKHLHRLSRSSRSAQLAGRARRERHDVAGVGLGRREGHAAQMPLDLTSKVKRTAQR